MHSASDAFARMLCIPHTAHVRNEEVRRLTEGQPPVTHLASTITARDDSAFSYILSRPIYYATVPIGGGRMMLPRPRPSVRLSVPCQKFTCMEIGEP